NHPQVAAVYNSGNRAWQTVGIREVLTMFLYLYTNAATMRDYFTENAEQLTRVNITLLDRFLKAELGAPVTEGYNDILLGGAAQFVQVFTAGLDAAEAKLLAYQGQARSLNDYVTDNLDNEVKSYSNKVGTARRAIRAEERQARAQGGGAVLNAVM